MTDQSPDKQFMTRVVETAEQPMALYGADGFCAVSGAFASLLGYSPSELLGKRPGDLEDKERNPSLANLSEALRGFQGGVHQCLRRRDGNEVWVIWTDVKLAGDLTWALVLDVSRQNKCLADLGLDHQRLLDSQRLAGMVAWDWMSRSRETFWSPELHEILGLDPKKPVKTGDFSALIVDEDRGEFLTQARRTLRHGRIFERNVRIRREDGHIRTCKVQAKPYLDENGVLVRVNGNLQDLTDRINTEDQLAWTTQALQNSIEGVVITDQYSRIIFCNKAFSVITGFPQDQVLHRNFNFLLIDVRTPALAQAVQTSLKQSSEWRGELRSRHYDGRVFTLWAAVTALRNKQGRVTNYIALMHDLSDIRYTETRQIYEAQHSYLTGLPNRQMLMDSLNMVLPQIVSQEKGLAVMFLDMDNFTSVNDSLGYTMGDMLLKEVARRLSEQDREYDIIAHLGEDSFVLLRKVKRIEEAMDAAQHLLYMVSVPYEIKGEQIYLSASIGVAFCPEDGEEADILLKKAEKAMYRAKEYGSNSYRAYTESMDREATQRLDLYSALRQAVVKEEFLLYYQPKVNLKTGAIVGMEALVRWSRPGHGMISPGEFIPLAEQTGLILPMGEWILRQACLDITSLIKEGHGDMVVAVNLAALQLQQDDLVPFISRVIEETVIPPRNLELEITEGSIMKNVQNAILVLELMNSLGVSISVDDFGTGHSSLYYLKSFPLHKLKIDQSFVRDLYVDGNSAALITAIISMAHSLNLEVVAEGVEEWRQVDFLRERGCDQMQGYLFSRPLPFADLRDMLNSRRNLEQLRQKN